MFKILKLIRSGFASFYVCAEDFSFCFSKPDEEEDLAFRAKFLDEESKNYDLEIRTEDGVSRKIIVEVTDSEMSLTEGHEYIFAFGDFCNEPRPDSAGCDYYCEYMEAVYDITNKKYIKPYTQEFVELSDYEES